MRADLLWEPHFLDSVDNSVDIVRDAAEIDTDRLSVEDSVGCTRILITWLADAAGIDQDPVSTTSVC